MRFFSSVFVFLFVLIALMTDYRLLVFAPFMALGIRWYSIGILSLTALAAFLIYSKIGGLRGLILISLALLTIEAGYLDRERAPLEHYLILLASIALAFSTYFLMDTVAPLLPRFEVTALAALVLLLLYLFSKLVVD